MKDSAARHFKTYIFLAFVILFAPLGNVLLAKGMKNIGSMKHWSVGEALPLLGSILSSGYILAGDRVPAGHVCGVHAAADVGGL